MSAARARRAGPSGAVLAVLGAVLVLAVAVVTADALSEPPGLPAGDPGLARTVSSGTLTCGVAVGDEEQATVVLAAGEDDATVEVTGSAVWSGELDADSQERVEVEQAGPVTIAWRDAPVVASWYLDGDRDAAAPCVANPASTVWLAGLDTSLGGSARLHLVNPYPSDAVVRVRFGTSDGPVDLVRTENVVVRAQGRAVLDLSELQPEETELGVAVETLAGRVYVEGELERQRFEDEETGTQGRTLVPAVTELATTWHFASLIDNDDWDSAIAVYNPSDREAAIVARATDPADSSLGREISVPAGGVARLDLADASTEPVFGLVVSSANDVPVVVSRIETTPRTQRTAVAVTPGVASPSVSWLLPGLLGERADLLAVHNPAGVASAVTVRVAGEIADGWDGRVLAPNELAFVEGPEFPVRVTADQAVVVEHLSTLAEGEDLGRVVGLAADLVPDLSRTPPPIVRDPGLRDQVFTPGDEEGPDLGLDDVAD